MQVKELPAQLLFKIGVLAHYRAAKPKLGFLVAPHHERITVVIDRVNVIFGEKRHFYLTIFKHGCDHHVVTDVFEINNLFNALIKSLLFTLRRCGRLHIGIVDPDRIAQLREQIDPECFEFGFVNVNALVMLPEKLQRPENVLAFDQVERIFVEHKVIVAELYVFDVKVDIIEYQLALDLEKRVLLVDRQLQVGRGRSELYRYKRGGIKIFGNRRVMVVKIEFQRVLNNRMQSR
ncbi:hypothetical protein D3C87_1424780 [compost metagenome]